VATVTAGPRWARVDPSGGAQVLAAMADGAGDVLGSRTFFAWGGGVALLLCAVAASLLLVGGGLTRGGGTGIDLGGADGTLHLPRA
jgi:hypothetical protein